MRKPGKKQTVTRKTGKTKKQRFPPGWDEVRIREVLAHYENQTEEEAAAEDEAAFAAEGQTVMVLPTELVPQVRALLARWQRRSTRTRTSSKSK
jgi:hypothetical protein